MFGFKKVHLGLAALGLGFLVAGAGIAKADTINVTTLVLDSTVSPGVYEWHYTTDLDKFGEIEAGDYVDVHDIPDFLSTAADDATDVAGADGTTWDITYIPGSDEVKAVYTGNAGTIVGPVGTQNGSTSLIDLSFLDSSNVDDSEAFWDSDDHNPNSGDPEPEVVGQAADAPYTPVVTTGVPLPSSAMSVSVLMGLVIAGKLKKKVLA